MKSFRSFVPAVERLEDRECLAAPTITGLSVTHGAQHWVTLSGQVADERPDRVIVMFGGRVFGAATPNAAGQFQLTAEASGLGPVSAIALDDEALFSALAQTQIANLPATIIQFTGDAQADGHWTFSGRVVDEHPQGLRVAFTGAAFVAGRFADVQADGSFSLTVSVPAGESGMVKAQVLDWWGFASDIVQFLVEQE